MIGLLFVVATLAPTDAGAATSYTEAYRQHKQEGKPLVVLVGADWCPDCRSMKGSSIPAAVRSGALEGVAYTFVDSSNRKLASRLMRGSSIPQLIMFYETPDGPRRVQLTGAQDVETIRDFVATGGVQSTAEVSARNPRSSANYSRARLSRVRCRT